MERLPPTSGVNLKAMYLSETCFPFSNPKRDCRCASPQPEIEWTTKLVNSYDVAREVAKPLSPIAMQSHAVQSSIFGIALLLLLAPALCVGTRAAPPSQKTLAAFDPQVSELLSKMTLEEKIGQMMQPDQGSLNSADDVTTYCVGSLLSGGGSGPKKKEDYTLDGWTNMVENYQQHALQTRLKIPLLYGIDAVHGHNNIPNSTLFPHNIGLGCTRDAALVQQIERITAEEVRATGINWVFAPCVTVPQDIRWGRSYEGYSSEPDVVKLLGPAAVQGFQGDSLDAPLSVVATAKHFVGDGGTAWGSAKGKDAKLDQGDTQVDEATLRRIHLPGYRAVVDAGVATIMPSYSSWNGVKCSANKYLLTDVLKKEFGFEGFLISDYNAIDQISPDYRTSVATSINAGMDMVMMTTQYARFATELQSLVKDGTVPISRIDDAVRRILRVKFAAGLFSPKWSATPDPELKKSFGSAEHRAIARQAVRESLVLLKNDQKTLPISRTAHRIHLAGQGADNLGMQCGGWTLDWQGSMRKDVPGATSLLTAFQSEVGKDCKITFSADGSGAQGADVAVVVIGEKPYAEGRGDRENLEVADEDKHAIDMAKSAGVPVVVVIFSGRPIILGDTLEKADAVVAAWLPGSEGEGITDLLLGNANFMGKLSFPWPGTMADIGSKAAVNAKPLFDFGFGLEYPK
jgi:beta-glucosidase